MRKIYAELTGRIGERLYQLVEYPPEGYRFIARTRWPDKVMDSVMQTDSLWRFRHQVNRMIPVNLFSSYFLMRFKKIPPGVVLTYSESPLVFRKEPWVIGVEVVIQFAGYDRKYLCRYKRLIEKNLASPWCRKLICWSEAAKRSVLAVFDSVTLESKLEVVYPAGHRKDFVKDYRANPGKVKILFISSGVTPGRFEQKGGKEALEAFARLRSQNSNLELVIRSDVPDALRRKYQGIPGLRIIEGLLPKADYENLYRSADIYWYPAHSLSSVVVLEAMSYGLPVVTTDYYNNAEFVKDGETGFVIQHASRVPPWDTSPAEVDKALQVMDDKVITDLMKQTLILAESPELREKMGQAGRKEVERGQFSLEHKNRRLASILDEALAPS